jgi:DNA-3-methyladenine glycosylase II
MAVFTLHLASPFRLDLTVWVLRRVAINQTDRWDGGTYRRMVVLGDAPVGVEVVQGGPPGRPELRVSVEGGVARQRELTALLEKMLGLNVDLCPFYRLAEKDRRLAQLIEPFAGFRPPRLGSAFETLLNGIACQQISMTAGMHLLNRLAGAYGRSAGGQHAFPRPVDLASAAAGDLRPLGFSGRKAQTILDIARAIVEGRLDLEGMSDLSDEAVMERLLELKGIGRWTAQYILLRGLGRLDVFPVDDVGGQNKMQHWLGLADRPDHQQMDDILSAWRPYRGLLYFYLLLDYQGRLGLHGPGGG